MAVIAPDRHLPPFIHPQRFCRNRQIPAAPFVGRVSRALHHVLGYRRKLVFQYHAPFLFGETSGIAGSAVRWRFRFHSGYSAEKLVIHTMLARSTQGSEPRAVWTLTPDLGSPKDAPTIYGSRVHEAAADAPATFARRITTFDLDPNTTYSGYLTAYDYVRPFAACVHEAARSELEDTEDAAAIVQPARRAPILASHVEDLWTAQNLVWQRNGAHLFSWSRDTTAVALTTTTYTNIWDQTSTSVSSATPGASIMATSHSSRAGAGVPVRFAAYAYTSSGTGDVQLIDASGALVTLSVTTTPQWVESAGTIPDGVTKVDVQARANTGGATVTVEAVSLYEYA